MSAVAAEMLVGWAGACIRTQGEVASTWAGRGAGEDEEEGEVMAGMCLLAGFRVSRWAGWSRTRI